MIAIKDAFVKNVVKTLIQKLAWNIFLPLVRSQT
jgi:hypothetical protein